MRTFNIFLGDGKTDTGMPQRIQAAEDGDLRRASPLWLLEDECEMSGVNKRNSTGNASLTTQGLAFIT